MKFQGQHGSKVLVITAYQVSQSSAAGLGMETVYMQQWQKLVKTRTKVNPVHNFGKISLVLLNWLELPMKKFS